MQPGTPHVLYCTAVGLVITHADGSRVSIAVIRVCVCVCVSVVILSVCLAGHRRQSVGDGAGDMVPPIFCTRGWSL